MKNTNKKRFLINRVDNKVIIKKLLKKCTLPKNIDKKAIFKIKLTKKLKTINKKKLFVNKIDKK